MHYLLYVIKYIIFIAVSVALAYGFYRFNSKTIRFCGTAFITIYFFIISAIRCNFGSDFYSYYRIYNIGNYFGSLKDYAGQVTQFAFNLLMQFANVVSDSPYAIFWVAAGIIYPLIIFLIVSKSKKPVESLAVFLLFGFFDVTNNILKQSIALAISLWGYELLKSKKRLLGISLFVLACTFHTSTMLDLLLVIISFYLKPTKRILGFSFAAGCVITVLYTPVLNFIIRLIPLLQHYEVYASVREHSLPFVVTSLAYTMILAVFAYLFIVNGVADSQPSRVMILILSIPFAIMSLNYIVVYRICLFAVMQIVILIPELGKVIKKTGQKIKCKRWAPLILLFFIIVILASGNNRYYCYSTQFDSQPSPTWYR